MDKQPPTEQGEQWRDVVGYEGLYMVSNRGRVWSMPRVDSTGRRIGGRFLTLHPQTNGYLICVLYRDGKRRTRLVHQILMRAFVGAPPVGEEVCHGLAGKLVNHWPENLRYGTKPSNNADKLRAGTWQGGERHNLAKLTEADVIEIRGLFASTADLPRLRKDRWSQPKLAAKYGIDQTTVSDIIRGKSWSHLKQPA